MCLWCFIWLFNNSKPCGGKTPDELWGDDILPGALYTKKKATVETAAVANL